MESQITTTKRTEVVGRKNLLEFFAKRNPENIDEGYLTLLKSRVTPDTVAYLFGIGRFDVVEWIAPTGCVKLPKSPAFSGDLITDSSREHLKTAIHFITILLASRSRLIEVLNYLITKLGCTLTGEDESRDDLTDLRALLRTPIYEAIETIFDNCTIWGVFPEDNLAIFASISAAIVKMTPVGRRALLIGTAVSTETTFFEKTILDKVSVSQSDQIDCQSAFVIIILRMLIDKDTELDIDYGKRLIERRPECLQGSESPTFTTMWLFESLVKRFSPTNDVDSFTWFVERFASLGSIESYYPVYREALFDFIDVVESLIPTARLNSLHANTGYILIPDYSTLLEASIGFDAGWLSLDFSLRFVDWAIESNRTHSLHPTALFRLVERLVFSEDSGSIREMAYVRRLCYSLDRLVEGKISDRSGFVRVIYTRCLKSIAEAAVGVRTKPAPIVVELVEILCSSGLLTMSSAHVALREISQGSDTASAELTSVVIGTICRNIPSNRVTDAATHAIFSTCSSSMLLFRSYLSATRTLDFIALQALLAPREVAEFGIFVLTRLLSADGRSKRFRTSKAYRYGVVIFLEDSFFTPLIFGNHAKSPLVSKVVFLVLTYGTREVIFQFNKMMRHKKTSASSRSTYIKMANVALSSIVSLSTNSGDTWNREVGNVDHWRSMIIVHILERDLNLQVCYLTGRMDVRKILKSGRRVGSEFSASSVSLVHSEELPEKLTKKLDDPIISLSSMLLFEITSRIRDLGQADSDSHADIPDELFDLRFYADVVFARAVYFSRQVGRPIPGGLWVTEQQSTAELMSRFKSHSELVGPLALSEILRAAHTLPLATLDPGLSARLSHYASSHLEEYMHAVSHAFVTRRSTENLLQIRTPLSAQIRTTDSHLILSGRQFFRSARGGDWSSVSFNQPLGFHNANEPVALFEELIVVNCNCSQCDLPIGDAVYVDTTSNFGVFFCKNCTIDRKAKDGRSHSMAFATCCICKDNEDESLTMKILKCRHTFCEPCLTRQTGPSAENCQMCFAVIDSALKQVDTKAVIASFILENTS